MEIIKTKREREIKRCELVSIETYGQSTVMAKSYTGLSYLGMRPSRIDL